MYCLVDGVSIYQCCALQKLGHNKVVEHCHIHLPQPGPMPQSLDYGDHNPYLTVTLSRTSHIHFQPSLLSAVHPSLAYHGKWASYSKADWDQAGENILAILKAKQGVLGADVQVPKQRVKRGSEEL